MLQSIKDRYTFRIEREIARGGMGTIYEVTQIGADGFEKRVAIKTLRSQLSKNERFTEMFIDEGKLVADLVHENIVQIYQLGLYRHIHYIVMEFVHGLSLHDVIHFHAATSSKIPPELTVFTVSRIARGLAYAHSRLDRRGKPLNIVHRDVCPTNIMITTEGLPKLLDFGIAKAARNTVVLNERTLMGKLLYMSPEQAQRKSLDWQSDIYSLGLVLFEMLALTKARARWDKELMEAAKQGWVDWDSLPENLDKGLRAILETMLAQNPGDRYDSTNRLAHDLEYHIYREGYGPTVVTLENYLRKHFAYLYRLQNVPRKDTADKMLSQTVLLEKTDAPTATSTGTETAPMTPLSGP